MCLLFRHSEISYTYYTSSYGQTYNENAVLYTVKKCSFHLLSQLGMPWDSVFEHLDLFSMWKFWFIVSFSNPLYVLKTYLLHYFSSSNWCYFDSLQLICWVVFFGYEVIWPVNKHVDSRTWIFNAVNFRVCHLTQSCTISVHFSSSHPTSNWTSLPSG